MDASQEERAKKRADEAEENRKRKEEEEAELARQVAAEADAARIALALEREQRIRQQFRENRIRNQANLQDAFGKGVNPFFTQTFATKSASTNNENTGENDVPSIANEVPLHLSYCYQYL